MKSIIQSIRPQYVRDILNGIKTIEVRKRYIEPPFKVYIYCTKTGFTLTKAKDETAMLDDIIKKIRAPVLNGKVVAEYVCDEVDKIIFSGSGYYIDGKDIGYTNTIARESCLQFPDLRDYLGEKLGYAYHITDLKIYDKPKELGKFHRFCGNDGDGCPDDDCPYYETPSYEYGEVDYDCQSLRPVERPPQDFMYVEELK